MKKIILVFLTLSMIFTLASCGNNGTTDTSTTTESTGNGTTSETEATTGDDSATTDEADETTRNLPTEMKTGNLILVNSTYSYDPKDAKNLVKLAEKKNTAYSLSGDTLKLKGEVVDAMNRMFEDFKAATGEAFTCVTSAYRDGATGDLATGLSFAIKVYAEDELTYDINDPKYKENYKWIADNCNKYGFILRYPANKASETGDTGRVNYFRYVGIPHATYIYANNLSLEGYITKLKEHNGFDNALEVSLSDQTTYKVYYVTENADPNKEEFEYAWSGNNIDGYIVTLSPKDDNTDTTETEE